MNCIHLNGAHFASQSVHSRFPFRKSTRPRSHRGFATMLTRCIAMNCIHRYVCIAFSDAHSLCSALRAEQSSWASFASQSLRMGVALRATRVHLAIAKCTLRASNRWKRFDANRRVSKPFLGFANEEVAEISWKEISRAFASPKGDANAKVALCEAKRLFKQSCEATLLLAKLAKQASH